MSITYFGSVAVPTDGAAATNATTTITFTPPSSMVVGDLVYVELQQRGTATFSNTTSGGQLWFSLTRRTTTNVATQAFWCRYNGTWATNPIFTFSAGTCTSGVMIVYRPSASGYAWGIDQAEASATFTAPSTPFTVTRTGVTTTNASTVSIATFMTADDNEWNSLSGSGWVNTSLSAQYRNVAGTDQSMAFAYQIKTSAGATNNVSLNQSTLGGDAGLTKIVSFYEYDPGALYPSQIVTSAGTGNRTTALTSVPAGAMIVVSITTEDDTGVTAGDATITDTATLTWTKAADAQSNDGSNTQIWYAVYSAGGNTTVTGAWGSTNKNMVSYVVAGQEGTPGGASATGLNQANPSVSLTTGRNNSLVIGVTGDWSGVDGASRAYRNSETEAFYSRVAATHTGYHYFKIVPTSGTASYGLTAPSMENGATDAGNTALYEIRLPAGGGGTTYDDSLSSGVTAADSITVAATFVTTLSESGTTDATQTALATFVTTLSNDVTGAASEIASATFVTTLSNDISGSSSESVEGIFNVPIANDITGSDSIEVSAVFNATNSESITADNSVTVIGVFITTISEDITALDEYFGGNIFVESLSSEVTASDNTTVALIANTSLNSSISADAVNSVLATINGSLSESLSAEDSVTGGMNYTVFITENITAEEVAAVNLIINEAMASSITAVFVTDATITEGGGSGAMSIYTLSGFIPGVMKAYTQSGWQGTAKAWDGNQWVNL